MKNKEMELKIEKMLEQLRSIPPRDPATATHGRAHFLNQAAILRSTVSRKEESRHIGWINTLFPLLPRKEHRLMNTLIAVVLAIAIVFGGGGATVYAAQESLPDQGLYQVKILSEDVTLSMAGSPQAKLKHELNFSDRRIEEVASLVSAGADIPVEVIARYQSEMQRMLELAAGLDDPQMLQELEQIRTRTQTQLEKVTKLMEGAPNPVQPTLLQLHLRLQEQARLCTLGAEDPLQFRLQIHQRQQEQGGINEQSPTPPGKKMQGTDVQGPAETPAPPQNGNGNNPSNAQPTNTSGQYGPGKPQPTSTPGPYGPGEPQPTTTPGQYGPGEPQPTATPGQNGPGEPQSTATPDQESPGEPQPTITPGQYGPGPNQTPSCTPQSNGEGGNKP
jgi:hypothetical protein